MTELEALKSELKRLSAINAIQNMVSTTSYMFAIGEYSTILNFLSQRDDVTARIGDSEVAVGPQAVNDLFVGTWEAYAKQNDAILKSTFPGDDSPEGRNGLLDLRALASPIIEVAGDGQSAKGLWLVPGTQTFAPAGSQLPVAHWVWKKIAMDFILEEDRWRIWHVQVIPVLATSYHTSWVERSLSGAENTLTLSNPYSVHSTYPHPPAPPKPYQTFSDTFSY